MVTGVQTCALPICSNFQISRKFELNVNIIFGNIELIGGNPIGGLVSIVQGDAEQIDAAIEYLKDKNVGVEVIFDGRVSK